MEEHAQSGQDGEVRGQAVRASLIGREAEIAAVETFLAGAPGAGALVLEGAPGIGKTTLWEAGLEAGRRHGFRVLSARPSDAEARLAFAGLIDLFDGVETRQLDGVPPPQLEALEVALLRAAPPGRTLEPHAIALGTLNALRALADAGPVLIAIDDVQSLDTQSASPIAWAARRLEGIPVAFLLARRPGPSSPVEDALEHRPLAHLSVRPLTLGATRRLLHERVGSTPSRQLVRRIYDVTLGNPLFVLEVGRALRDDDLLRAGRELPVPHEVEELLGIRVAGLPVPVRRLLLAVALSEDLSVGELAELEEFRALDAALDAGVVRVEGDVIRASHPLLAAAATQSAGAAERRQLHRRLAGVVVEPELRIRHFALATVRPDAELAARIAASAAEAARRGAAQAAVELSAHSLRLTPRNDPERVARVLERGHYLEVAGELDALEALLTPLVDQLPAGEPRVRAYMMLSAVGAANDDVRRCLARALAESADDARLRATVVADLAMNTCLSRVEGIPAAASLLTETHISAREIGPDVEQPVLYALGWARALCGRPLDDLVERFRSVSDAAVHIATSLERIVAQRLAWRGEIVAARGTVTALLSTAEERGERTSYALQRLHLCELELRAGRFGSAEQLLDDWAEPGARELMHWAVYHRCRALLAAGRGNSAGARALAAEALSRSEATGVQWDRLETMRALGIAALLDRSPDEAARSLRAVWDHTQREGVRDPGVFPVAPDLVEALAELGELDEAAVVTSRVRDLAEEQSHPWGRVSARRCSAVTSLAVQYEEQAAHALEEAAREYAELDLAFDRGRTLLSLGRAQRRHKKWGAARATLEQAAVLFDELGSQGWAEVVRAELTRVGARRPAPTGDLTPTERRAAELAAQGLSNKEIARALVVTVSTVEFHLSNTYAKLGIRSRGQLAGRVGPGSQPPPG